MGKDKSTASKEAKRAHSNAQAKAHLKRVEKRKRAVSRNGAESAGVHTPAVLFQTPHTSGPVLNNDDDDNATPRVHTQGEMSGREDTGEDAGRSQSPPAPSTTELHREFCSFRDETRRGREGLVAVFERTSARVQELEQALQQRPTQQQLAELEAEYGRFQGRINRSLKDKADQLSLLMDTLHDMRVKGTPAETIKAMMVDSVSNGVAQVKQELTALHTSLATSGVCSQASESEEEDEEEGEAVPEQQLEQQPVQQRVQFAQQPAMQPGPAPSAPARTSFPAAKQGRKPSWQQVQGGQQRGQQSGFQAGQQAVQPGGYQGKGRGNPSKKARQSGGSLTLSPEEAARWRSFKAFESQERK